MKNTIYLNNPSKPIRPPHSNDCIRGWGNLTGAGAHNLSVEEAANIQDTFADFIVERLNFRK